MIGSAGLAKSGAMPIYRAAPNPPLSLEERKDAALKELRALRPYDADLEKKQKIVSGLLGYGFDINEPIDEAGGVKIRLLDMACQEMDDDFASFLVGQGANPRLCTNAAWFIDDMVVLFDSLQAEIANPDIEMGAIPAKSGAATSSADIEANVKNASERNWGRCLCDIATIFMRVSAVGIGGALYGTGVIANGVITSACWLPAICVVIPASVLAGIAGLAIDNPINLFRASPQDCASNFLLGLMAPAMIGSGGVAFFSLLARIPLSFVSLAGAELIVAGLGLNEQEKRNCREKLAIGRHFSMFDVRIASVKEQYARWQFSHFLTTDIANDRSLPTLSEATINYNKSLCLAEDALTAWQKSPKSYSNFVSFVTCMNDLVSTSVDRWVLMSKEERAQLLASKQGVWDPKFDGYVRLEFALSTKLTQALHNKDKALALSCCAVIREIAPGMRNDARYNLFNSIRVNGGRGHALSYGASGYQILSHEDPDFYAEFKAMKIQLKTLLNGERPPPRSQSTNLLYAIGHYKHVCETTGWLGDCVKAYAELLALIPESDRAQLIDAQYRDWTRSSLSMERALIYGLKYAANNEDKELALSYIGIVEVAAPHMKNEDLFRLSHGIYSMRRNHLAFNAELEVVKNKLDILLGGWTPPPPPPSDSYSNQM